MMEMRRNRITQLARYFSDGSRPVSINEFFAFWNSLSDEEKNYYLTAELT